MVSRRQLCQALALAPLFEVAPELAVAATTEARLMSASLTRVTNQETENSGLFLSASWEFDLSDVLLESLKRGIPLYFIYEFRLEKSRWYWVNKDIADVRLLQRISYSPLSRMYRVSQGGLTQSFENLDAALPLVKNVALWRVADESAVEKPENYLAQARIRLDLSRLPKPLQISIGGNSDWIVESDWEDIDLTRALKK